MNQVDIVQVKELINEIELIYDIAKEKIGDLKRAIDDPNFLKSAIKSKERELSRKMDELLRAHLELSRIQNK